MKLLCISNGHGEDVIACRILSALGESHPSIELFALPITGAGSTYHANGIPIIGPTQVMPSGGFINRDPKQLARDVSQGLVALTRSQLAAIKTWANANANAAILAVGDIVPQIFSHLSGLPYVFVGTAKSEYWLRDEQGKLAAQPSAKKLWSRLEGWSGSVYLPWERWLMARPNCRTVFVRDALTATTLQALGIRAHYAGNPMMDGLAPEGKLDGLLQHLTATT
ncbi:MAG: lipid-A-disaccharide synthase-related protein, partial [Cyanobacteria bacterium J06555_13]